MIPLYNKGPHIEATLGRLLAQSRPADEIIVVDDAGTDDGAERVEALLRGVAGARLIRLTENRGPGNARNVGLAATTGDYVMPLDADDPLDPHALERVVEVLERYAPDFLILTFRRSEDGVLRPTIEQLDGVIEPIDGDLHRIPDPIAAMASDGMAVIGSNLVCRREAIEGIEYDTTTRCFEGVDFWYRALSATQRDVLLLSAPLLDYLVLPDGLLSRPIAHLGQLDYPVLLQRLADARTPADRAMRRRLARAWLGNARERLATPLQLLLRPKWLIQALRWGWL